MTPGFEPITDLLTVVAKQFACLFVSIKIFQSRSPIHGRGLYCTRNIAAGEMVIEYSGMLVRSVLTDKREKYYESKV